MLDVGTPTAKWQWGAVMSVLTGQWKSTSPFLVALGALFLISCTPARNTAHIPNKDANMSEPQSISIDAKPTLLDPERQLYRFGDGICRDLSKLPAPWRLVDAKRYEKPGPWGRFPPGYDTAPRQPLWFRTVALEADNAAFGIAPANTLPGPVKRSGRLQHVVSVIIGPPGWGLAGGGDISIKKALAGHGTPVSFPIPVSPSFQFVTDAPKEYLENISSLSIINPALSAGLYTYRTDGLTDESPNPFMQGLIVLDDGEEAKIELGYEALAKLEEVIRSATEAARAIRVQCPIDGE